MFDISYFHELGKTILKKDIDELEMFLKSQGRLKSNLFKSSSRSLIILNYEEYKFDLISKNSYSDNSEYVITKYPGFTYDDNYKETSMGNVIIPSDKKIKKYYDRRRY